MDKKVNEKKNISSIKYFLSGGFGGICTVLFGHPLDTIKVRLQTMPKPLPGSSPLYAGMFDCARKTVKFEGVFGLYKGMGAPLVGVSPIFALSFLGFSFGKKIVQLGKDREITKGELFFAGAFSGIFITTIMAPGERIKTLLQVQQGGGEQKYTGPLHVIKELYKIGGIKSIYKGTVATLLRDVPGSGMYFMTYEWIQESLTPKDKASEIGLLRTCFAGGLAGICYWIVGTPPDILKSRLQSAPEGKYPHGIKSVFTELMREEGPLAFYRGVTPVMIRAFFANAACFIGFEFAMKFLNWVAPKL